MAMLNSQRVYLPSTIEFATAISQLNAHPVVAVVARPPGTLSPSLRAPGQRPIRRMGG